MSNLLKFKKSDNSPAKSQTINVFGKQLRTIILESPYDNLSDPFGREYFAKLMNLKVQGYKKAYHYGPLPIDNSDFIANHITIAEYSNGEYFPIMGFKSTTLKRCETHCLNFPLFDLIKRDSDDDYFNSINSHLKESQELKQKIAYNGSWTICFERAKDKKLRTFLKDITYAYLYHYYTHYKISNNIAAATIRYGIDKNKENIGYKHIKSLKTGKRLSPVKISSFGDVELSLMILKGFTSQAETLGETFKEHWENRLTIKNEFVEKTNEVPAQVASL